MSRSSEHHGAAGQIVQPPRGRITDYSQDWLVQPSAHGVRVTREAADGGKFPYLLVEPDTIAGPAARGRAVREQLTELGMAPPPFGEVVGNVVLLHGRTGRKDTMLPIAERFCAAGFRCLIPDLPAQGESRIPFQTFGASELEGNLAATVLTDASRKHGFSPGPAGLFGMSMGSAYAISAASREPERWKAVVLLSTVDSLPLVIQDRARQMLGPLAPLFVHSIERAVQFRSGIHPARLVPAEWARNISTPTMVVHGTGDSLFATARGKSFMV